MRPTKNVGISGHVTLIDQHILRLGFQFLRNACAAKRHGGYPIDYANPCPDSQVTSLHYHFPWYILANVRWSVFCAATRRPMRRSLDWDEFYAAHDPELDVVEQAERYASIARRRLSADRFEEFCEEHLSGLEALAREFFASDTARDAVRQKVSVLYPRTRSSRSRICSSIASRPGAPSRPNEPVREPKMSKTKSEWHSARLGETVTLCRWGEVGSPVLIFPTAGGDAEEIERFLVIDTLAPLLEAGRIKIYSCDSVGGRVMATKQGSPAYRMAMKNRFQEYVYHEVVPAIRQDCNDARAEIVATGASIGAFNALAMVCRYPDAFRAALCLSGSFDMERFLEASANEEFFLASPLHFVPQLAGEALARLRTRFVLLASAKDGPRTSASHGAWRAFSGPRGSRTASTPGAPSGTTTGPPGGTCGRATWRS